MCVLEISRQQALEQSNSRLLIAIPGLRVMQISERIALGAVTLWILYGGAQMTSEMVRVFRAGSRSAHERQCRKELALKCKVRPACRTLLKSCCISGRESWHVV